MKHKLLWRLGAMILAAVTLMCLTPGPAMADGGPDIQSPSVTWLEEELDLLGSNFMNAGKDATLYIPVVNRGTSAASSLVCKLPYNAEQTVFPFEGTADAVAAPYMKFDPAGNEGKGALVEWNGSSLAAGERAWFKLSGVKALSSLVQGNLQLIFMVCCAEKPEGWPVSMEVYVNNSEWKPASGSSYKSKPKVIIESYGFDRDHIYAGDTVRVNICVRNTSVNEDITNMLFDFSDDSGKILPISGGSRSVFLGKIKKGEAYQMVLFLNVAPDAESKTYPLSVKLKYEGTKNRTEFTEETSIAMAVQQRIRVRLTDPVIYGDPWVGQSVSMGVSLYNLSKATIYNCSAELQGDGLSLEEPFFGGNVAAGGTMRADLSVISENAGEVKGDIVIQYEDAYGEPTTETVSFTMFVNEMEQPTGGEDVFGEPEVQDAAPAKGFGWYWWVIIAAVVIAGGVVLIMMLRKRRKKYLEEL